MTRPQFLGIRTRLALAAASVARKVAPHFVASPLGAVPSQTAEIASFPPGTQSAGRMPAPARLPGVGEH